jgi:hypothetical protein
MTAQPSGPDDAIVATVGGRPVYAACVAAQAGRNHLTREAALRECVDFELLAQAADARGLAADHEVVLETRRELVSRLVETDFERRVRTPADLAPQVEAELARNQNRMERPELRRSFYIRVLVPDKASADVDAAAHALADRIHAALANEVGLFAVNAREIAERVARGSGASLDMQEFKPAVQGYTVPAYDAALFSIPEVGRVSEVARTPWGYDILLLTEIIEHKIFTRDEVVPLIFADARRVEFVRWANAIREQLAVTVLRDDSLLDPKVQP